MRYAMSDGNKNTMRDGGFKTQTNCSNIRVKFWDSQTSKLWLDGNKRKYARKLSEI